MDFYNEGVDAEAHTRRVIMGTTVMLAGFALGLLAPYIYYERVKR